MTMPGDEPPSWPSPETSDNASHGRLLDEKPDSYRIGAAALKVLFVTFAVYLLVKAGYDLAGTSGRTFDQAADFAQRSAGEAGGIATSDQSLAAVLSYEGESEADDARWLIGGGAALGLLAVRSIYRDLSPVVMQYAPLVKRFHKGEIWSDLRRELRSK